MAGTEDTSGPAVPILLGSVGPSGPITHEYLEGFGLTVRDYFEAAAMQALIGAFYSEERRARALLDEAKKAGCTPFEVTQRMARQHADAHIKARKP